MQETTLRQDNTNRIRTLQAARFLFILLIYLSHSVEPLAHSPFDFGGEGGVAFFFVLSGFVLSYGYGPRVSRGEFDGKRFFWKHFWHLYPLHLLFFSATVALDYRLGVTYDALQIATSLLLVQTWIPSDHTLFVANGVSWFLCDTLFCYIVFAWLYKWLTSIRTSRLAIGMTVLAAVYACLALQVPDKMTNCTLYSNPQLRAIDFSLGIIAYRFYNDGDMVNIAYGKETCNPAARFLIAKGNAEVSSLTAGLWEIFSEDAYEKVMDILCGAVADYVEQNPDLRNQPTEDMWDFKDEEEDY